MTTINWHFYELPSSKGDFGTSPNNPIPVAGVKGEIIYLNTLKTKNGKSLFFHRLGSFTVEHLNNPIDVYEVVSVESDTWTLLYFEMYNSFNSSKVPEGFMLDNESINSSALLPFGLGCSTYVNLFPMTLSLILNHEYKEFNVELNSIASSFLSKHNFIREFRHILKILSLPCIGSFYDQLVRNCSSYPLPYFFTLLESNDLRANIFSLHCLQRFDDISGSIELYRLMAVLCYKTKDEGIINEVIKIITKHEPMVHEYCNGWLDMNQITDTSFLLSSMIQIPVDKITNYLSVPYLYLIVNNENSTSELLEICLGRINSIINVEN